MSSVMVRNPYVVCARGRVVSVNILITLRSESQSNQLLLMCTLEYTKHSRPPTKCYIHALHARIALLEDQLMQYRCSANDRPAPPSILEDPKSHLSEDSPQQDSLHLPFYGRESRLFSAYGHFGLLAKFDGATNTSQQKITIIDGVLLIDTFPVFLEPSLQGQLLDEFWTWQNTWPVLIHEPLFRKDLLEKGANNYSTPTLLAALLALSTNAHLSGPRSSDSGLGASAKSLLEHAKSAVQEQIEHPTLSLVLSAALISQSELSMENMGLASQYIGK